MFQTAYMRGKRFLFTEDRIKNEDVPKGLFKYEIRHSDDDDTIPVEITDLVFVNFFGTLIGPEPIENWDEQTVMKRSVILEMDSIPEYYRDEEDDITEEEFDENGNKNTPVFYPMDGELDIDFDEEYDIPLEEVSEVFKNREKECDILYHILDRLKMDDIYLSYEKEDEELKLIAKDSMGNVWHDKEFYEFLINEAFVFEEDGSVLGLKPEVLKEFKKLCDIVGVEFPQKTKQRTYTVIIHYEGAYDCKVEATSEDEAREKAEKLFNEADLTDVWNNIDYAVGDCYEC